MKSFVSFHQECREYMKSRNQYAKTIRRIEIGSNFLLIIGILVSFFMSLGLPGTIGTVVLYILLTKCK